MAFFGGGIFELLELPTPELKVWLKEIKKKLGCGGFIEGDALVFAGDQRERLPSLLEERRVGKVTVS